VSVAVWLEDRILLIRRNPISIIFDRPLQASVADLAVHGGSTVVRIDENGLMRYLETAGETISKIGLGTWQFGSREWGYGEDYATREANAIVDAALETGINFFDTAEVYAAGRSEEILGRALGDRRAFVATKFLPVLPLPGRIERHAEESCNRLGIDQIDLYQMHWPNPVFPTRLGMEGIRRVQKAGTTRHVGVSNYSLRRWKNAEKELGGPVLSNQVLFNLVRRQPLRNLIPYAASNERVIIAYSPLAQGLLSGKYGPDKRPRGFRARNPLNPLASAANLTRALPLIEALREVGTTHGATPAQVALAWVLSHPNTVAIPGASSVAQVRQNAQAADLDLSEDEITRLSNTAESLQLKSGIAGAVEALRS
jgi:aryl-alcohol dehydrogenase-like predicted oxidoreductase